MKKATREAYGETLARLAQEGMNVYAVDADLSGSTTTKKIAAVDPSLLVNVGIAEQNMIGVAAGLSLTGAQVFTGSFAVFGTGRCYDQIRNTVCYGKLNVNICPTHAGVTVGPDGGSHQMLEDISLMRTLPAMRVLVPADYVAAGNCLDIAAHTEGPVYVRMGRAKVPVIYDENTQFELGGSHCLKEGTKATVVACGVLVSEAFEACEILAQEGIDVELIDAYSIKPLDAQSICASAHKTRHVITVEEHMTTGGLGSAVAEALFDAGIQCTLKRVGVEDAFGTSGDPEELIAHFGLDAQSIADIIRKELA